MKSNFEFLADEWKALFDRAKSAEEYAYPDIRASYVFSRMALELAIKLIYENDYDLDKRGSSTLDELIKNNDFKERIGDFLKSEILEIKNEGNNAVHNSKLKYNDPKIILKKLFEFSKWFHRNYSEFSNTEIHSFDEQILKKYKDVKRLSIEELKELEEKLKADNQFEIEKYKRENQELTNRNQELEEKLKKIEFEYTRLETEFAKLKTKISENKKETETKIVDGREKNVLKEANFSFNLKDIGLTEQIGKIWGRVFANLDYRNENYYAIKYFAPNSDGKVEEKILIDKGKYQDSPLFMLFDKQFENLSYDQVKNGSYNQCELVKYYDKERFGTPSILIEKLLLDLKKQFAFKKGDKEWQENGFYIIDNKEYMSIWTFKKHYKPISENITQNNGSEAIILLTNNTPFYTSKPDFGDFKEIKIYPVEKLKEFYSIN